ncbi:MAG: geranylgeranylglycerol-phosphate geranylgeranyltransferase [Bacteroidetes bacterium]|nr:geranylgeranylglycerol-phosphate geranylgeranyltransferase [Bacteroidota bacterium]
MLKYVKLIRLPNLLFVALVMYAMRLCIIKPILQFQYGILEFQFSDFYFFLFVLSTVFLAAAGYVINDYFDRRIDLINRPNSVVVGKLIDRRYAMAIHTTLNFFAIAIGVYLSVKTHIYIVAIEYFVITGLFWFYSTTYKRQFLVGNILVSLMTAVAPIQVVLFDIVLLNRHYTNILHQYNSNFYLISIWILGFAFFAFITNLIREIIKDAEDYEGDKTYKRKTIPIVWGEKTAKIIVVALSVITTALLIYIYIKYLNDNITFWYFSLALIIPFIYMIFKIIIAKSKKQYHFISQLLKVIMLAGVMYSFVARYIISNL